MTYNKPFDQMAPTAARLMLRYSWFMGMYYTMQFYECHDLPFKTLATNGVSVWVDPKFWGQLDRDRKMTAVAHELGHKVFMHPSRLGARNPFIWNIAGDHVINLMLQESGFKPLADMTIDGKPFNWFCDPEYKDWTTEAVYDDLMDKAHEEHKKQGGSKTFEEFTEEMVGTAKDLVRFGETPDGQPEEAPTDRPKETEQEFENRVRHELKAADQAAKMAGNVPAWMKRALESADHVRVHWYEVVEQHLKSMSIADYSWSRFSRREFIKTGVIAPDLYQPAMGGVRMYIDASGSCWDDLPVFNHHMKDIWEEVKPKWIEVRYFQTTVNHEYDQRFDRGDAEVQVHQVGGGGTNFSWLADDLEDCEERPEVCLFLTDMEGRFGREPDIPVIWVSVSQISTAPFGEVVNVN
jgi:predicted metal-dependent peptidase